MLQILNKNLFSDTENLPIIYIAPIKLKGFKIKSFKCYVQRHTVLRRLSNKWMLLKKNNLIMSPKLRKTVVVCIPSLNHVSAVLPKQEMGNPSVAVTLEG